MEPWRMDGDRMELWSYCAELLIAPLALVACGNLKKNDHHSYYAWQYFLVLSVILL